MRVVPELGGDEELLALDNGRDDLFERGADLVLVLVDERAVYVAVPVADSVLDLSDPRDVNIRTVRRVMGKREMTYRVLDLLGL
jgi:hypothetical protein